MKEEKQDDVLNAVKIPVSKEFIDVFFRQSNENESFQVIDGLKGEYICGGVIQSSTDGVFYFMFSNDKAAEGQAYVKYCPTYQKIYDIVSKDKVKAARENLRDWIITHQGFGPFAEGFELFNKELELEQ